MKLINYSTYLKKNIIVVLSILFILYVFSFEIKSLLSSIFSVFVLIQALKSILIIVPILIAVAFLTLFERKIMAAIQRRRGPNVVGLFGILQPFADGLKLLIKETILPSRANQIIFIIAPILTIFLSFMG